MNHDQHDHDVPDLPPEVLNRLLQVWGDGFVSGIVTHVAAELDSAVRRGLLPDHESAGELVIRAGERFAQRAFMATMRDPIARHAVVDAIQRGAAGNPRSSFTFVTTSLAGFEGGHD